MGDFVETHGFLGRNRQEGFLAAILLQEPYFGFSAAREGVFQARKSSQVSIQKQVIIVFILC